MVKLYKCSNDRKRRKVQLRVFTFSEVYNKLLITTKEKMKNTK